MKTALTGRFSLLSYPLALLWNRWYAPYTERIVKFTRSSSSLRGFTLIELLVVIAIIGILSSVALASLALGRLKAADAAIQSDVHTVQSQMEIYYSNNNSFGTAVGMSSAQSSVPSSGTSPFYVDGVINAAIKEAMTESGSGARGYWATGRSGVSGSATSWAVAIRLRSDTNYWWCLDSSGTPVREPAANMTGAALAGGNTDARCP
jgi:prepilin-type N-terminal cleavage/methylation domain-containing protein